MALPIHVAAESYNGAPKDKTTIYCDNPIIGQSDLQKMALIPNVLNVNWVASATQVIISVYNVGVDSVDTFAGTVVVQGGITVPFSAANLAPLSTRTIYVNVNMQKCYESITVNYYGIDGGTEFGEGSSPGHREIPSDLSSYWVQGTLPSVYDSINYHFYTHASEVYSTNIVDYATKAANYRNEVVSDLSDLPPSYLADKYTITVSPGATPSHKYKNKVNGRFIIISDAGLKIVSFGR